MKRRLTYLFLLVLVLVCCSSAQAGTDFLCNAMAQSNIFLKQAGEVQHEYSSVARQVMSTKVSPDDLLGDSGRAAKEKVEKKKEKAESLKEKAEKVKEFAEQAKERKEELEAQAAALKAQAEEKMAAAQEAIAQGQAAKEEAMNKAKEAKAKVQEAKEKADEAKEQIKQDEKGTSEPTKEDEVAEIIEVEQGAKSAEEIVQDQEVVSSTISGALSSTRASLGNNDNTSVQQGAIKSTSSQVKRAIQNRDGNTLVQQGAIKPISNQADAIVSAVSMAEETIVVPEEQVVEAIAPIDDINSVSVTPDEIMALAKNRKVAVPKERDKQEVKTDIKLEDQLLQATSKAKSNQKKVKDIKKSQIVDSKIKMSERLAIDKAQLANQAEVKEATSNLQKAVIKEKKNDKQL